MYTQVSSSKRLQSNKQKLKQKCMGFFSLPEKEKKNSIQINFIFAHISVHHHINKLFFRYIEIFGCVCRN